MKNLIIITIDVSLMFGLGSLESTEEARVARGVLLRIFRCLQTSRVFDI